MNDMIPKLDYGNPFSDMFEWIKKKLDSTTGDLGFLVPGAALVTAPLWLPVVFGTVGTAALIGIGYLIYRKYKSSHS
jgi:hypothetical protein